MALGQDGVAAGVEKLVGLELQRVRCLYRFEAFECATRLSCDGAGEVTASGVEGEILPPEAALVYVLLGKQGLLGGRELVQCLGREVEILVRVVETLTALMGGLRLGL
ncbi:hypothetical protein SAY86_031811 [Trapa natans]|uniref:Uncharacterized protein n=1 Tax=Trapa natans TaxID=22666 RepID=A0AAN7LMF6_TRANT|nr:hypothetical protein SAY86_031811 [Trapa natans]